MLYLLWLCATGDHEGELPEVVEPPVPRGLAEYVDKQERERQKRMQQMVKEPNAWLKKSTKLVDARGTSNYETAAEMLADLREAVGGAKGKQMTRKHVAHLVKTYPTLTRLKSSLRKHGLLE